jgi:cytochrome P450
LHREYRRLINAWFTQARVAQYEGDVRVIVNRLIDEVIEAGRCDFMDAFARPFPGAVFFELVLHAPPDEAPAIVAAASAISADPAGSGEHRGVIMKWIHDLVEQRRGGPRQDDVVDAVIHAEIEGRPITDLEITAIIQLLIFGGLDTTAGALGQMMMRFCRQPEIPALLRERPELVPDAVEELLRLDGPLAYLGRTATRDVELGGSLVKEGDKVLVGWMSANRDGDEFEQPEMFDLERPSNRHLAFGAGPHRCAGSNLARMDLRIAVGELARRFHDLTLEEQSPIPFHSGFSRAPAQLEISFQPAARESQAVGS